MHIGPGNIKDIEDWPMPKNKKEVERFLGFTTYPRACIEEYTQMALPLQALTGKRTYQWGEEQERENHFPIQTPEHQVDDSRIRGG
jgi:hypothetical protein